MTLETDIIAYLEYDNTAFAMEEKYKNCPLNFRNLLIEHRQSLGEILQREILEEKNSNYQPRTIAQENARIAKIKANREGKTNAKIMDKIAEKYGI